MSTALAIASVTAVLVHRLQNGLTEQNILVSNPIVKALPPDRIAEQETADKSGLNLFLYQVTPNIGWRNVGLPSHNGRGKRVSNPPLGLDLHYLLTAFSKDEYNAEVLLGYGMQLLHENPVLSREVIRSSITSLSAAPGGAEQPSAAEILQKSELADQVEQIKIIPESISIEDTSKMWPAFQAKYRPTVTYQASVVLIESRQPTRSALPVKKRKIYAIPIEQPAIERLLSQDPAGGPILVDAPILPGYNLVIEGTQLRADHIRVNIDGILLTPADENISDNRIIIKLPTELPAGVHGVQIAHYIPMGEPLELRCGPQSNLLPFVLRPQIVSHNVNNVQGSGGQSLSADVEITIDPPLGDRQRVTLVLNEYISLLSSPPAERTPMSYTFAAPPRTETSPPASPDMVTVPVTGVRPGTYLARIQVDGAESPLKADSEGYYDSPKIDIQ